MSTGASRSGLVLGAAVAGVLVAQMATAGPPLRRELEAYHLFALRNANVKNYSLNTANGACNIGVNCQQPPSAPSSDCGVFSGENVLFPAPSQLAADVTKFTKPGGSVWQLFSNRVVNQPNVTVGLPPIEPLAPLPILGDLDGDGTPSCSFTGGTCNIDSGDLAAGCGMTAVPPACDLTKPVLVQPNADCLVATDEVPGNNRCDLKAGVYGNLTVQNGGKIDFLPDGANNAFVFCSVLFGQDTEAVADTPVLISATGDFDLRNGASFGPAPGEKCGQFTVHVYGAGTFTFGRESNINGFFCAPERLLRLGHNNRLTGRFFADDLSADSNDVGFCCPPGGECACFDKFDPKVLKENASLTLSGSCTLAAIDEVKLICGATTVDCAITTQTPDSVVCTVPVIPGLGPHVCQVRVVSSSGIFTHVGSLTVNDL